MNEPESIVLAREVIAIQVPSGDSTTLPAGTRVQVAQALGGTYTVHLEDQGGLYRIGLADADALGKTPETRTIVEGEFAESRVWDELRNCYDPEIPVNIVDLGLIYRVAACDDASGKGKKVEVQMTLTAPGCGMGPSIASDARQRILGLPGVADADVQLVWDPPWSPQMISPAGKEFLGIE